MQTTTATACIHCRKPIHRAGHLPDSAWVHANPFDSDVPHWCGAFGEHEATPETKFVPVYNQPDHRFTSILVKVAGSNNQAGWKLGGWTAEGTGRKVMHGPMEPGPHAFANAECAVLSASPLAPEPYMELEDGDIIQLRGTRYTLSVCRRGYVWLKRYTP